MWPKAAHRAVFSGQRASLPVQNLPELNLMCTSTKPFRTRIAAHVVELLFNTYKFTAGMRTQPPLKGILIASKSSLCNLRSAGRDMSRLRSTRTYST